MHDAFSSPLVSLHPHLYSNKADINTKHPSANRDAEDWPWRLGAAPLYPLMGGLMEGEVFAEVRGCTPVALATDIVEVVVINATEVVFPYEATELGMGKSVVEPLRPQAEIVPSTVTTFVVVEVMVVVKVVVLDSENEVTAEIGGPLVVDEVAAEDVVAPVLVAVLFEALSGHSGPREEPLVETHRSPVEEQLKLAGHASVIR